MFFVRCVADIGEFSAKTRGGVSVREGQGVVLMCTPPPHSPGEAKRGLGRDLARLTIS